MLALTFRGGYEWVGEGTSPTSNKYTLKLILWSALVVGLTFSVCFDRRGRRTCAQLNSSRQ